MVIKFLTEPFVSSMGVDLGTANTIVCVKGEGLLIKEPSVVAVRKETGEVLKVGKEARKMLGRTPDSIMAVQPMEDGVIHDFEIAEKMLSYFINKAHQKKKVVKPRIVVCVPSEMTDVERRSVIDATLRAGAREAYLIEEAMAAAIGVGLPIQEAVGSMVVDIGGGTTEIAVISLGGIVTKRSVKIAGNKMDEAIVNYIKDEYNLVVGNRTAEEIKINLGSICKSNNDGVVDIRGRDLVEGLPKSIEIDAAEIKEVLMEPIQGIIKAVKLTLDQTPPELLSDILERGIVMVGGGALLTCLDELLSAEIDAPVYVAEDPLNCVANGTCKVLEELDDLKDILVTS
ncbi:rod shape-determining protein [Fuchsiella alkaliacetigena]|uniref:rod shape-determining protein n=1 Tax=Fuchsiella alkaliacetigena TaxID=957042 RepID=UPI00200A4CB0|nr:rod shape-determining protein [Fuchsiella alkaliacetigena]MCK8825299.1 rod shape-determining protein [Fuchsiella alkaliacetigena]